MIDLMEKYESNGHFFFDSNKELDRVCNAPKKGVGVFIVFELKNGRVKMVYIGSAGKITQVGKKKTGKDGLYGSLVNGMQFDKPRWISWKEKLKNEKIDALDVYWCETFDKNNADIPATIEAFMMQKHYDIHGQLPKWNEEF